MKASPSAQVFLFSIILGLILFSTSWIAVSYFTNTQSLSERQEQMESFLQRYLSEQTKHVAKINATVLTDTASAKKSTSDLTKADVENIIKDYLLSNPEIIEQAAVKLREQQAEQQEKRLREGIARYSDNIFRAKHDYVAGNPDGDVTIVEFFDYNCGFCRRAFGDLARLIEADPKVRVVFKELPIFGADSQAAARAAIASIKQNKYFEFHRELLIQPGNANQEKSMKIAKELGMDLEQLQKDMEANDVRDALEKNMELSQNLGVEGTPFYIVGNDVIPGAPDDLFDQLVAKVKTAREIKSVAN
ncbi:MAG: DsbA family protein [Pseudomonadota bacterium]